MARKLFVLACLLMVAGVFATSGMSADLPSSVKMAVAMPFTGPLTLNGKQVEEGAILASELINKAGGIAGKTKLNLLFGDSRCNPTSAVNVTTRLIGQGIDFYIGNFCSSASLATMPILASKGIPQIILAYAPTITGESRTPNSVRIGPSAGLQMAPLAKYAVTVIGDKKFASIALNNDFGRSMSEEFAKTVKKLGGEVVDFQYYSFGADFSTYLTKVKNMQVDAVQVVGMGNDPVTFTKTFHELGLKMNIYANDNFCDRQYLEKMKPKPQNLYFPWLYNDNSKRMKGVEGPDSWITEFVKAFEKKHNRKPTRINAWGYACVSIFKEAIEATGTTDKKKIAEYMHSGAKFKTPFGEMGFASCGQAENRNGLGKYDGEEKIFVKGKRWGDDVVPSLCPK
jgi:branched-chain amino acid transport system substrate-binding protein